jgi:hypothetical protein
VALRLIAYAQHGINATEESIVINIEVPLPKIDPPPLALPPAEIGLHSNIKPEVKAEDIAAQLPDLDSLDINAFNNINSLIPSVNMQET